jgi:hypothetical protein
MNPSDPPSRSDLALERRAARERWGVPDRLKTRAIEVVEEFLDSIDRRERKAALAFLATAVKCDQADDKLDMERAKLTPPKETQARDAWSDVLRDIVSEDSPRAPEGSASGIPVAHPRTDALE